MITRRALSDEATPCKPEMLPFFFKQIDRLVSNTMYDRSKATSALYEAKMRLFKKKRLSTLYYKAYRWIKPFYSVFGAGYGLPQPEVICA